MHRFFSASGECAVLVQQFDWGATPLGPMAEWSECLRTMVGLLLHSRQPMLLFWGPEHICLYNDAFRPSFGRGKHPAAMGRPAPDVWEEAWPVVGPQIDSVMRNAEPTWHENQLVPLLRNGRMEEAYWTYGYSPALSEFGVEGAVVTCTETTSGMVSLRRLRSLHELSSALADAPDGPSISRTAVEILYASNPADVGFVQVYDSSGTLVQSAGLSGDLAGRVAAVVGPGMGLRAGTVLSLPSDLDVVGSVWPERVPAVFITEVAEGFGSVAYLVCGISPRLDFDEAYRDYLEQVAEQIGAAHSRVEAFRMRAVVEGERNDLLEQAPVAASIVVGPDLVYRLANPRYLEMVGGRDILGKAYVEAFPELEGTEIVALLKRVYATGESFTDSEMCVPLLDDEGRLVDRYFNFVLQPIRDVHGEVFALMAIAIDITEQVEARKVLEAAATERIKLVEGLEQASRAKDEFLAMLGHELRNPLAPIVTALEVLRLRGVPGIEREWGIIDRSARHMVGLVDDLLDVSRIASGLLELELTPLHMVEVIDRAVEMASPLLEQRGHRLTVDVPSELRLGADAARLAQVIANLLTNAAKYTEPGGEVALRAAVEGEQVVISVSDNGMGIAMPDVGDLFQAFVRVDRQVSVSGLGLGLAIVKSIVEAHGGVAELRSDGKGRGATCTVRIPQWPDTVDGAHGTAKAPPATPTGRQVFVVDDNRDAADLLAIALEVLGFTVHVTYDPWSALELAAGVRPDIALLDIGLPGMDGHDLCKRLRALPGWHDVHFVAVTGYGQRSDRERSLAAGFHHHLVKPVDLEEVTEIIDIGVSG